jgi:penicillin-binding protein 1A
MVGGWSFARSKFNRAVQAYRQLGSTFKPIVYTTAIDRGFTPSSIIVDEPAMFPTATGEVYAPSNYDHKFEGPITLRRALEDSRNIPAVKMMDTLSPESVVRTAKRFGFGQAFPPYLSMALGAGEGTLLEATSAEPPGAHRHHPRGYGVCHHQPAGRRHPARHRHCRGADGERVAARRKDRHG